MQDNVTKKIKSQIHNDDSSSSYGKWILYGISISLILLATVLLINCKLIKPSGNIPADVGGFFTSIFGITGIFVLIYTIIATSEFDKKRKYERYRDLDTDSVKNSVKYLILNQLLDYDPDIDYKFYDYENDGFKIYAESKKFRTIINKKITLHHKQAKKINNTTLDFDFTFDDNSADQTNSRKQ